MLSFPTRKGSVLGVTWRMDLTLSKVEQQQNMKDDIVMVRNNFKEVLREEK